MRIWNVAPDGFCFAALRGGKGGSTQTTVTTARATADQVALQKQQVKMAEIQVQEIQRQNATLEAIFPQQQALLKSQVEAANQMVQAQQQQLAQTAVLMAQQQPYLEQQLKLGTRQLEFQEKLLPAQAQLAEAQTQAIMDQTGLAREQIELAKQNLAASQAAMGTQRELADYIKASTQLSPVQQQIKELSEQRTLDYLQGKAPPVSEAQQRLIDTAYQSAAEEGSRNLRLFGEEMAGSRGLNITDSPIGDEMLRQQRYFQQNLTSAKAQSTLGLGTQDLNFNQAVQQFQGQLQQQAFQNRMQLMGSGQVGLGMTQIPNTGVNLSQVPQISMLNPLGMSANAGLGIAQIGQGIGQIPMMQTTNTRNASNVGGGILQGALSGASTGAAFGPWGAVIGGVGGGILGGASASSARYKRHILPLDEDEYDAALERVRETPITRYRYNWEGDQGPPHIGPILELAPPEITDDGHRVNLLDYAGLQHAALKAVNRKVDRLQEEVGLGLAKRRVVEMKKGKDGKYAVRL